MRRFLVLLGFLTCTLAACNLVITPTAPGAATTTAAATGTTTVTNTASMTMTGTITPAVTPSPMMTATEEMTGTATSTNTASGATASAQLQDASGNRVGTATFTENSDGTVNLQVVISGFTAAAAGQHGIHVHQVGACTPTFAAAGEHFNPTQAHHGLQNPAGPHAGDLPNLNLDANGNASYSTTSHLFSITGNPNLLDADGSALVIHAAPDDQTTDPSGNSGERIACGVIVAGNAQ